LTLTTSPRGSNPVHPGTLYVCGTPLGNLEDITLRALRVLKQVDLVAAEDTRRTAILLNHYDIHTPRISYREENREAAGARILEALNQGKSVALVSDAGMPGIADPGVHLVRLCRDQCIPVVAVPGPSAPLAALSVSGFCAERFAFEGFLPASRSHRRKRLEAIAHDPRPQVFFLTPHQLLPALGELRDILGDRRAALARELTKRFEEVRVGLLSELVTRAGTVKPRGEYTVVVEGFSGEEPATPPGGEAKPELEELLGHLHQQGLPRSRAVKEAVVITGLPRRRVYQAALGMSLWEEENDQHGS